MAGFRIGEDGIGIPEWTTANRPVPGSEILFGRNTTLGVLEYFNGSEWEPVFSLKGVPPYVEYLCVAGGGGSGSGSTGGYGAGGGGAGGVLTGTYGITPGTPITITVGLGGTTGATGVSQNGTNGGNSSIDAVVALGGGFGMKNAANGSNLTAGTGGSGGGAGYAGNTPGQGTTGQGYSGGWSFTSSHFPGGGGGGAGGSGRNVAYQNDVVDGGPGVASSITGTSVFYGVGGKGGSYNILSATAMPGSNGTPNRGNGGNAGYDNTAPGAGGSGVVILRWPNTYRLPISVTGTPVVTNIPGFNVYTWNNSGSVTFS